MDKRLKFQGSELEAWMKNWRNKHSVSEEVSLTKEESILFTTELYNKPAIH